MKPRKIAESRNPSKRTAYVNAITVTAPGMFTPVFAPARFSRSNRGATFSTNHCAAGANAICCRFLSALPPKADMCGATRDVRFGPRTSLQSHHKLGRASFMGGFVEPLPLQHSPFSSSKAKQLG
jgi:hypothetical protein